MQKLLFAALAALIAAPALASSPTQSMICENPRQEYLVTFDQASRALVLNPDTDKTRYRTISVRGDVVSGLVGHASGLAFQADFSAKEMRYYSGLELVETDECRPTLDVGL